MKTYFNLVVLLLIGCIGFSQNYKELEDVKALTFIPDYLFEGSVLNEWQSLGAANWSANNGSITGRLDAEGESGILVYNQSYQDVAFQVTAKRNAVVEIGLLFRFEKQNDGFKAVLLSVDANGDLASFNVHFDEEGNEIKRDQLARAGGIGYRIAPPVNEEANQNQGCRSN